MARMRNIRLTLSYDGTNYVGWQVQPNGPSVQAAVERAIRQITGDPVRLLAAGRTDSGVHALGQVANFPTTSGIPTNKLAVALDHVLPADIAVRHADEVPLDFHATYWSVQKRYRYVILHRRQKHPFLRHHVLRFAQALDVAAMQTAANALLGSHDFKCFESDSGRRASSVRTVTDAVITTAPVADFTGWPVWPSFPSSAWEQRFLRQRKAGSQAEVGEPEGSETEERMTERLIIFDIVADGFLYNMVRAIVGTLLDVGRGRWTPDDMRRIMQSRERSQAGQTAPPHGLYLVSVDYDEDRVQRGLKKA